MDLNPSQFRLLLAGAKVSRLLPFVTSRGYVAAACQTGSEAVELLRREARHVLLVELELDDMLLAEVLQVVRAENLAGAVLLLDDPAKSGMIISQLIRGVDGYIATPPDELYLFRIIERQLLAQWALAQTGRATQDKEEKQRLEKSVQAERAKVTQLVKDIAALREELNAAKAAKRPGGKLADDEDMDVPDTQLGLSDEDLADDELEDPVTRPAVLVSPPLRGPARPTSKPAPQPVPGGDERTSPIGWDPPAGLRRVAQDVGFDDDLHTLPGLSGQQPSALAPLQNEDGDDDELFLDLEDPTTANDGERKPKGPGAKFAPKGR